MIKYHEDMVQGSDEWLAARCGLLTASEMKLVVTPSFRKADNDKSRAHMYELLAQRITRYVEPMYVSDDMMRGREDEIRAREMYEKFFAPVKQVGFITNDKWGFTIGYSPDGLVGEDGCIEVKSRCQKYQVETILDGKVPKEHVLQVQTGLLVSERKWCDYISFCAGLPLWVIRVFVDDEIQTVIVEAASEFEDKICSERMDFDLVTSELGIPIPERIVEQEIIV